MGKAPVPVSLFSRCNSTREDLMITVLVTVPVSVSPLCSLYVEILPPKRKKSYQTNAWYDSILKIRKTYFSKNCTFAILSFNKGTKAVVVVVCVLTFALSFSLSGSWYALEECEEVMYHKYR